VAFALDAARAAEKPQSPPEETLGTVSTGADLMTRFNLNASKKERLSGVAFFLRRVLSAPQPASTLSDGQQY